MLKDLTPLARRWFVPLARVSIFVIYFWFGFIKLIGASPAEPLAHELVNKTIGASLFDPAFFALALLECIIGVLFLLPRLTKVAVPVLLVHMFIVCGPLVLVPSMTWDSFGVPTLEGQYIIKNLALASLAIGIAAYTTSAKSAKK